MLNRIGLGHFQQALSHRDYRLFAGANFLSSIGTWMQRVGVGWLAWELTHSSFWVGLIAFMDFFPVVLLGLLAGAVTDRVNVKNLFSVGQWAMAAQSAVLAAASALGVLDISGLLVLSLVQGIAFSFNQPSRLTIVSHVLPRTDLPAGIAFNAICVNTARFIGPAIAGAVIVASGPALVFALNALSFLPMIWWLRGATIKRDVSTSAEVGFLRSIPAGLSYVVGHAGIGPLLLALLASALLVRCFVDLLPAISAVIFSGDAGILAALVASVGVGAVFSGLVTAYPGTTVQKVDHTLVFFFVSAVGLLAVVVSDVVWIGVAGAFVSGFGMTATAINVLTLVQSSVAEAMRGRVLALYGMLWRGGSAVGALAMGMIADIVGLRSTFLASAVAFILICFAAVMRRQPIADALSVGDGSKGSRPAAEAPS